MIRLGRFSEYKFLNHSISRPDMNKRAPDPAIFKRLTDDLRKCTNRFCDLFLDAGDSKTNGKIEPRRKKHYYPNYFPNRAITNDTFISYG